MSTNGTSGASGSNVYRRLLGYSKPYWAVFLLAIVAMAMQAATVTSFAMLVKPLIDGTFVERDPTIIRWMPLAVLGLFLSRGVGGFVSTYGMEWIGRRVVTSLRQELFDKLLVLPVSFFDQRAGGTLLSMFTYNAEQVSESATRAVTILVRDTLTLLGLVVWMLYLSPQLSIFILLIGPPVAFLIRFTSKLFRRYSKRIQQSMGDVTRIAEEAVRGFREIRLYGGTEYERARFADENESNRRAYMKQVLVKAASVPTIQLMAAAGLASIIFVASRPASGFSPGQFSSFIAAMLLLMDPLKRLTDINATLQRGIAGAGSIFDVLDEAGESDDGRAQIDRASGRVEYRNVCFAYEDVGDAVLDDISFTVEPGQTVAFVGRSGSGKSTLVNLLPRFYALQSGEIHLDGQNVEYYRLDDLRAQIAMVSQQVTLFNTSARHNIAYGALSASTEDELSGALQAANAAQFVGELPDGLDTALGDGGGRLSGGQRQRIAIARALLKNAPVLILDEATSALDSESEREIQTALTTLMANRTTLVIAHRLSTVENADRIVVMDRGRIVESGTHQELLALGGHYESLHRMQFNET
ncbi:MAG: lipid A export permease/ATP-binding protein MsbA [Gammaproteobacteria bacterium]